ncbi:MAG: HD domain-containing protein [Myxococcota bacterium]
MGLDAPVAQTSSQLYRQLVACGYGERELARVGQAYEVAASLHSARFRPSGRPFICHAVGTASILAALGARIDGVLAGLLHGAYDQGDFGDGTLGIAPAKRRELRETFGEAVEARLAAFSALAWDARDLRSLRRAAHGLDATGREVLLLRLANELEELLDLEILFRRDAGRRLEGLDAEVEVLVGLCEALDQPRLAAAFRRAAEPCKAARLPAALRTGVGANHDRPPRALSPRLGVRAAAWSRRLRARFFPG